MSSESAQRDLQYYLKLASSQLRHRLNGVEGRETYSVRIARMRMLEELIKEQIPHENSRASTRPSR